MQRDRPQRESVAAPPATLPSSGGKLAECVTLATEDASAASDMAQTWREPAANQLELAQSAHCLGLALVRPYHGFSPNLVFHPGP